MDRRASLREKIFIVGNILCFLGIGWTYLLVHFKKTPDVRGSLLIIPGSLAALGFLLSQGAFFARVLEKNRPAPVLKMNPTVYRWLRILAVVLWLVVLPLVYLWAHEYNH
jgi:hypothetical protein